MISSGQPWYQETADLIDEFCDLLNGRIVEKEPIFLSGAILSIMIVPIISDGKKTIQIVIVARNGKQEALEHCKIMFSFVEDLKHWDMRVVGEFGIVRFKNLPPDRACRLTIPEMAIAF